MRRIRQRAIPSYAFQCRQIETCRFVCFRIRPKANGKRIWEKCWTGCWSGWTFAHTNAIKMSDDERASSDYTLILSSMRLSHDWPPVMILALTVIGYGRHCSDFIAGLLSLSLFDIHNHFYIKTLLRCWHCDKATRARKWAQRQWRECILLLHCSAASAVAGKRS